MDPKFRGRPGSPSNTKSPGLRPTSVPSTILIHPAVSPQLTWPKIFRGRGPPPQFSAHVYSGQTAGWIQKAIAWHGDGAWLAWRGRSLPIFG